MNAILQKIKELEAVSQITLDLNDASFGEKVRAKREALGITISEMSRNADVPMTTIQRIEGGSRTVGIDSACKVANYLNEL